MEEKNILDKVAKVIDLGDTAEAFIEIMQKPDEEFNQFYGVLMEQMTSLFDSKSFQDEILSTLSTNPIQDVESERRVIDNLINEIGNDDTLSNNKKDFLISLINNSTKKVLELSEVPRERINVKIEKLEPSAIIPTYAHPTDSGADIYAIEDVNIMANETKVIRTGLKIAIPIGYEIQIRPRSGLSLNSGLRIANAPGTIDSNYRGEVGVIMTNIGINTIEHIKKGDKIAQMVIAPTPMIKWEECTIDENTDRGTGGFGSTGLNN